MLVHFPSNFYTGLRGKDTTCAPVEIKSITGIQCFKIRILPKKKNQKKNGNPESSSTGKRF